MQMAYGKRTLLGFLLVHFACLGTDAKPMVNDGDWPWWRGLERNGIAHGGNYPVDWDKQKNVVWVASIPGRGQSSPAVVAERVFLTTADEKRQAQSVLCLNRATGELIWQKELHKGGFEKEVHKKCSHAAASVASDGERIFVAFLNHKAIWLTCLDNKGKVVWQKKVCDFNSKFGFGASPLIYENNVIVATDNQGGGYLTAYDRRSGKVAWNVKRQATPSYSSPTVASVAGRQQLLLSGGDKVSGYDPGTGKLLWSGRGGSVQTVNTMSFGGKHVFASGGYPTKETLCYDATGSGKLVWKDKGDIANVPSMIFHKGFLYYVSDGGIAHCREASTGKVLWKGRLKGEFSASPTLAGENLYCISETGVAFLWKADPKQFKLVSEIPMGDEGFASPVACGGKLYLRVAEGKESSRIEKLYCIGPKKPTP